MAPVGLNRYTLRESYQNNWQTWHAFTIRFGFQQKCCIEIVAASEKMQKLDKELLDHL